MSSPPSQKLMHRADYREGRACRVLGIQITPIGDEGFLPHPSQMLPCWMVPSMFRWLSLQTWSFYFLLLPCAQWVWQDLSWKSTLVTGPVLPPAWRQKVRMEIKNKGKQRTSNNSEHTFPQKFIERHHKIWQLSEPELIFFCPKLAFFLFSLPIWVSF